MTRGWRARPGGARAAGATGAIRALGAGLSVLALLWTAGGAGAQSLQQQPGQEMRQGPGRELSALALLDADGVEISDGWSGTRIVIGLSRPVPWRVFTLTDPYRLVLDFSELDWSGFDGEALAGRSEAVRAARAGLFRPGWSRLVLELAGPLALRDAAMTGREDGSARVRLLLREVEPEAFAAAAGAPPEALFRLPDAPPATPPRRRQTGERALVVVLDPGHGGIDPGAERAGVREAELMLSFAREVKEVLLRRGGFRVVLTRESDIFVPLETRVTLARRAGADLFISLHADVLSAGKARGISVYTLSEEASDLASQKLAERHDRADLLAGVDLSRQGDEVALVLMEMARIETRPRAESLADALIEGLYAATGSAHRNARASAGFSVLKAPDIPSVLIELGYLSSPADRRNLLSADWRRRAAEGIADALQYWAIEDAAAALRLRQ